MLLQSNDEKDKLRSSLGSSVMEEKPNIKVGLSCWDPRPGPHTVRLFGPYCCSMNSGLLVNGEAGQAVEARNVLVLGCGCMSGTQMRAGASINQAVDKTQAAGCHMTCPNARNADGSSKLLQEMMESVAADSNDARDAGLHSQTFLNLFMYVLPKVWH